MGKGWSGESKRHSVAAMKAERTRNMKERVQLGREGLMTHNFGRVVKIGDHQTGQSNRKRDTDRFAMKPGQRMSANGKPYSEYRKNRSDMMNFD